MVEWIHEIWLQILHVFKALLFVWTRSHTIRTIINAMDVLESALVEASARVYELERQWN